MTDDVLVELLNEICTIDELNRNDNFDFPLVMNLIQAEQAKDEYLQSRLKQDKYKSRFGSLQVGNSTVHTFDGKI